MKQVILLGLALLVKTLIMAQGNVGIGTPSPAAKLHLAGTAAELLQLENTTTLGTNINTKIYFKTGNYYGGCIGTFGETFNSSRLGFLTYTTLSPGSLLERMSILDNGNVGIGTIAPSAKLHLVTTPGFLNTAPDLLQLENATALAPNVNTKLYFKTGNSYTGIIGTYGTGSNTARLGFSTYASATSNLLVERLSIADNGNIGVNNINPLAKLEVAGKTKLVQSSDVAALEIDGKIKVSGNKAAYVFTVAASDLSNSGKNLTIDNLLCNGDPNAMLFVTAREMTLGYAGFIVKYNTGIQKWQLLTDNYIAVDQYLQGDFVTCGTGFCSHALATKLESNAFKTGDQFNILIISN